MRILVHITILVTLFCYSNNSNAFATDSLITVKRDTSLGVTIKTRFKDGKYRDPSIAALRSTIIPGWGQLYNRRWYKVPLLYGGFAFMVWLYNFNNTYYKEFYWESVYRSNGETSKENPAYARASDQGIADVRDFYRRNRDLTLFAFIAVWGINIIDAYVDAKFYQFDISDDLTLKIRPNIGSNFVSTSNNLYNNFWGLKLTLEL